MKPFHSIEAADRWAWAAARNREVSVLLHTDRKTPEGHKLRRAITIHSWYSRMYFWLPETGVFV